MLNDFLPIGTIVMLKDGKKSVMITGYYPISVVDDKKVVYDYSGCIFPEGILKSNQLGMFNSEQIQSIVYEGFKNEESLDLIEKIKKIDKNALLQDYNNDSFEVEKLDY